MVLLNFIRRALGLDRRQHVRYRRPPLYVKIHDKRVRALDWSLGGCLLPPQEAPMRVGDTFECYISGIGLGNSSDCLAEVVRITKNGEIGLRWLELDSHVFRTLAGRNMK